MTETINAFKASRSGKPMTYAAPGTTVSRVYEGTKTPATWHRFIVWDNGTEDDQDERYRRISRWCVENNVTWPRRRYIRGYGYPIFVATASATKAMLFKLTFGGAA